MRADAVVVERQRVEQQATAFGCEQMRHLSDDGLRSGAEFAAKHDDDVALNFIYRFSCCLNFGNVNTHLACGQRCVINICESEDGRVFGSRPNMNELRRMLAQAYAHAVDEN